MCAYIIDTNILHRILDTITEVKIQVAELVARTYTTDYVINDKPDLLDPINKNLPINDLDTSNEVEKLLDGNEYKTGLVS